MFDETIKFKYEWRPYQRRILDEVNKYINDGKVNIVAAPGSGKTIIGLELARLINAPVLILAPTIVIRDQWIERFISNFTSYKVIPDWISTDIYDLKTFNVVTYQALHYAYKRQIAKDKTSDETDDIMLQDETLPHDKKTVEAYDIVEALKIKNITTIVLDEAHHLKSEWWKSLSQVVKSIEKKHLIALTATPPYDAEYNEWQRYEELCGVVDAEISIPELVGENNLCPHQDYVYFNYPTKEETKELRQLNGKLQHLVKELKNDAGLVTIIAKHPFIINPKNYEKEILENVSYYSSMLIYLNSRGLKIPRESVRILGHNRRIPSLTVDWLEILLKNILFDDRKRYQDDAVILKEIEDKLNALGVIEKRNIVIKENKALKKIFLNSLAKLDSINEIVKIETTNLKDDLRMVILTDYIRKEYLENTEMNVNKIGVLPIFINLLKENPHYQLVVLTGSFFIVPKYLKKEILTVCSLKKVSESKIKFKQLKINNNYYIVEVSNKEKNKVMASIQSLFASGQINIIIGTKSLLGEGWDEPSINSLILASFVGSYMLSNQMRGRAIRVSKDPNKTANIWHLVCVNGVSRFNEWDYFDGNYNLDYDMLKRRFKAFVGIDYDYDILQNGIERLNGVVPPFTKKKIQEINNKMVKLASNRTTMYKRWKDVTKLLNNPHYKIADKIDVPKKENIRKMWTYDYKFIFTTCLLIISLSLLYFYYSPALLMETLLVNFYVLYRIFKMVRIFAPTKMIEQIGYILLEVLYELGYIKTNYRYLKIIVKRNPNNDLLETYISGGTSYENNLFINTLQELLDKSTTQRYFIAKLNILRNKIIDYYNVPKIISQNKKQALKFYELWCKKMADCSLIYANSKKGRTLLIKARLKNISFVNKTIMGKKSVYWQ